MNEKQYLEWFAKEWRLLDSFFNGELEFAVTFYNGQWTAGYTYTEDYDGTFFIKGLESTENNVLDALRQVGEKLLPLKVKLQDIRNRFDNPKGFIKGVEYTFIALGRDGKICVRPMICRGPERDDRMAFRPEGKDRRYQSLYCQHEYKMIFPALPTGTIKQLLDGED